MKKILRLSSVVFLLSGACLLFWVGETHSQEGKIGYVDSEKLYKEFKEFVDAQAEYDKDEELWKQEIAELEQKIDSLKEDLDKTKLLLSEAKRKEKEENLEAQELEYKRLTNDIFGPGGRAEKRNAELTKPILDKIYQVLEKIATEENYVMIFDSVNCNIAYAREGMDLTDQVLEELNKLE
jgi:outer membrane protein